jgi:hypothetical protein
VAYADIRTGRRTRARRSPAPETVSLNWPVLAAVAFSAATWIAAIDLGRRLF